MAGFLDVLLRGLLLTCVSVAVGGIAWLRLVLRAEPYAKPDAATFASLRVVSIAAWLAAAVHGAIVLLLLRDLAPRAGRGQPGASLETKRASTRLKYPYLRTPASVF